MTAGMFKGLAHAGKYLLPLLCLVGAVLSAWRRRTRRELLDRLAAAPAAQAIDSMSWHEFEMLVGESFRCRGYRVEETGGGGPDGGVDLLLARVPRDRSCSASAGKPRWSGSKWYVSYMVRRQAARGEHAGREFWGCVTYPKCRGTREVAGAGTSG